MKKQLIDRSLVNDKIWSNTYEALRKLVDNSYYSQLAMPPPVKYTIKAYLKEFCTIRMTTSRQSGHTTAVCKLAHEYFDSAILMSPTYEMSKRFCQFLRHVIPDSEITKITKSELATNNGGYYFGSYKSIDIFRGISCEAVIIDGTFDLTPKKEDELYTVLEPCMSRWHQKFFIFVQ